MVYREPVWGDIDAHNERVAEARRAKEHKESRLRHLSPDEMVRQMQESPSHEKFRIFEEEFKEMMNFQMTVFGADEVARHWNEMTGAYNDFCNHS